MLTTLKIIQIPNGAPSKLPEEEQSRINAINEFCFPPQDWDRHHLPSIDAIDKQVIQSPWEDSFEFQTVDAEIEDAKLMKLQDEIIANFQTDMTQLENGQLEHWIEDHQGCLAYLILCDQFTRLMYRKTDKAYSLDSKSKEILINLLSKERESRYQKYRFMERWLLLLCLMRSETTDDLQLCAEEYDKLSGEAYN